MSHHLELLLPHADYLVRVLDGRIDAHGTPKDLRQRGELDSLVAMGESLAVQEPITSDETVEKEVEAVENGNGQDLKGEKKKGPGRKLVQDEERAVGNVKWQTYKLYIVAATYTTWFWTMVLMGRLFLAGHGLTHSAVSSRQCRRAILAEVMGRG